MVEALRKSSIVVTDNGLSDGLYVVNESNATDLSIPHLPVLSIAQLQQLSDETCSFDNGDVVYLDNRRGRVRSVLAKRANANTLLLTERCENRCQFCSQPPNEREDAYLYRSASLALLNYHSSEFIGLSGGEPTINRHGFITLLKQLNEFNNQTPLHILSNGRSFADLEFTKQVTTECQQRNVVWGIPLYGHRSELHDRLVGAQGAFVLTMNGILNLLSCGQYIELRIIPVRENLGQLPDILNFLLYSFAPLGIISIMQLEPKGWARNNYADLFVPVSEQNEYLEHAVQLAERHHQPIRLFNYPLCLLKKSLRTYTCQSISDWKNYYPEDCVRCSQKPMCGGFFTSATNAYLERVKPL